MNIKAVVFDLDGTLVHTTPDYRYLVVGKTLAKFNKSTTNSSIDNFWFRSEEERTRIIQEEWSLDPKKEFWPVYRGYDTSKLREDHTKPYEDTKVLVELKQKGLKMGIVTSAPRHIIDLELGMLNTKFDAVVRAQLTEGISPKPSPQGLEICLNKLSIKKENAIYTGNSPEDMELASNLGVFGVLIERGEYPLGKVDCGLRISSLYALRDLI